MYVCYLTSQKDLLENILHVNGTQYQLVRLYFPTEECYILY